MISFGEHRGHAFNEISNGTPRLIAHSATCACDAYRKIQRLANRSTIWKKKHLSNCAFYDLAAIIVDFDQMYLRYNKLFKTFKDFLYLQ